LWTSGSTNDDTTGAIPTIATDIATTKNKDSSSTTTTTSRDATTTTVSLDNILASLESDLSYFYLRDELGISEDVMWKITNEAPSVLGLKAKTVRNKVQVLQSLVGFTDAEIRQLITSQPTLLQLSVKKNLSPTILYWIRQLEMGKKDLKALILGCPALLKYSRTNIHRKLAFFQTTMGYSLSDCRKLLVTDPRLLTSSVMTGLIPRLNFLNKEVEISLPDIRKIALKNPRILLMSVDLNLTPKCVFYFIMTLQMESKEVGKMLLKYPQVLDYNLEHHILPIHHYFLSLDFSTHEFSRILRRYPRLITYSLIRIKRRIGYLRFELGLEANAIRRILHQCPQIVSLGQENIENTVKFLLQAVAPGASLVDSKNRIQSSGENKRSKDDYETTTKDGGDTSDAASGGDDIIMVETDDDRDALTIIQILIPGLPTLLALSIENNLKPKVEYLRERLGQEELSNSLLRLPALLGYSLENRIRPRLEKIVEAELPGGKITVAITLKEDAFDGWLERQIQKKKSNVKEATTTTAGRTNNSMSGTNEKNLPETTAEDDDTYAGTNNGNSRVVEEGGKIIHWRR
jgi:mTERF domain-containing protein